MWVFYFNEFDRGCLWLWIGGAWNFKSGVGRRELGWGLSRGFGRETNQWEEG